MTGYHKPTVFTVVVLVVVLLIAYHLFMGRKAKG